MFSHRNDGGDARKPASPDVKQQPGHPAAPTWAAEARRPWPPFDQPHPVRWVGRYLDR